MILYERELADGRAITVCRMFFTYRLWIGDAESMIYDDGWCYPADLGAAFVLAAAAMWDGDGDPPDGWIKQLSTGRRRHNGDPAREFVER